MAEPTLQKTWQGGSSPGGAEFVNVIAGAAPKGVLFLVKEAKIGFNSNPWTVIGSSDGVGASMDGTDRWLDSGDILTWSFGNPRSWIVLQQTALGATFHCLLANPNTNDDFDQEDIIVVYNEGGFGTANGGTDGTASVLPTPNDTSKNFSPPADLWVGAEGGAPTEKVLTCVSSTDGECARFLISKQSTGLPINMWGIEKARLPPAEWTTPVLTYMFKSTVASGLSCLRWETMADSVTAGEIVAKVPTIDATGFRTARMVPAMPMFTTVEAIDSQEDVRPNPMLHPPTLFGYDVNNVDTGRNWGTLFDWYWCSRNVAGAHLLDMDTVPLVSTEGLANSLLHTVDVANDPSRIEISDAAQTGMDPTAAITIECWVYVLSYEPAAFSYIVSKNNSPGNSNYQVAIDENGDRVYFLWETGAGDGRTASAPTGLGDPYTDAWFHVAVTRDTATGVNKIYVNGAPVVLDIGATLDAGVALQNNIHPVEIGSHVEGNYTETLHGYMREFRLWSDVRSPAEILDNYNIQLVGNEAGLECYLKLDTDLTDSTSNGNDFTALQGNGGNTAPAITAFTDPLVPARNDPKTFVCTGDNVIGWLDDDATELDYAADNIPENALKLDATEYLSIADGSYAGLNTFTCEFWLKLPSPGNANFRGIYGAGDDHWQMYLQNSDSRTSWGDKGAGVGVTDAWGDEVWEHWAYSFTTTTMTFFKNGVQVGAPQAASNVTVSTALVHLGNTPAGGSPLSEAAGHEPCYLADVRHWDFARSGAQILGDYQELLAGDETGLVANWPLQEDFSQIVAGGPAAWSVGSGTPTIENGVGPVL